MSDADATWATERCRQLLVDEPMPGVEPRDVRVDFNRVAKHTVEAYRIYVEAAFCVAGEDAQGNPSGPVTKHAAVVAHGKTVGEAMEQFYNWAHDPHAIATFREVVREHERQQVDVLASKAEAEMREQQRIANKKAREATHNWLEKKADFVARKLGVIRPKVQA